MASRVVGVGDEAGVSGSAAFLVYVAVGSFVAGAFFLHYGTGVLMRRVLRRDSRYAFRSMLREVSPEALDRIAGDVNLERDRRRREGVGA